MNAAGIWGLARVTEIFLLAPVFGKVSWGIKAADGYSGNSSKASLSMLVDIYARGCSDRPFRSLFEGRRECFFRPILFGVGRMAVLENVSNGIFGDLPLLLLFFHTNPCVLL
jgi:hypothetical protein